MLYLFCCQIPCFPVHSTLESTQVKPSFRLIADMASGDSDSNTLSVVSIDEEGHHGSDEKNPTLIARQYAFSFFLCFFFFNLFMFLWLDYVYLFINLWVIFVDCVSVVVDIEFIYGRQIYLIVSFCFAPFWWSINKWWFCVPVSFAILVGFSKNN